jgi:cephalosporin hydroxylase
VTDVDAILRAAYGRPPQPCRKIEEDLARYRWIIQQTRPDVIVETGTDTGASAVWFTGVEPHPDVITVDVSAAARVVPDHDKITFIVGDSASTEVAELVGYAVHGKRVMVALDSDHSGGHVLQELALYAPLVTPGCYLVVEDGFLRWGNWGGLPHVGDPQDAVEHYLVGRAGWQYDLELDHHFGVTLNVYGWWRRLP